MTFTHDDIKGHLIEFLYGELDGDARVAFDAHVAGCARCQADVAEFQQTRAVARAAVRAGLDEPVPAGVRARVLEAAAAAAEAAKKRPKSRGEASGPFAWLRARWAVPMFVTVAAMGALLLVRETIFREARKPLGEAAAPEATRAPSEAPAPAAAPATRTGQQADDQARLAMGRSEGAMVGSKTGAVPRPAAKSAEHVAAKNENKNKNKNKGKSSAVGSLDDLLEGSLKSSPRKAASSDTDGAAKFKREVPKDSVMELAPSPRAEPSDSLLGKSVDKKADKSGGRGFAQPPPPAAPAAGAGAPAPAPAATSRERSAAPIMGDESPRSEKKAKAPPRVVADTEEESAEPMAAAAPLSSRAESAASNDSDTDRAPPDPAAPLAARAEKLMASRHWTEAAAAYRQLIARFPKHDQVPNWKRRLSVVEAAAARAAPPAK